ncbi:MAG: competence damage-inducible protein A [Thaumarchaeota archaeon]|nr:competence damage-inducible protein A [Nitrososphaerota archaeon]
MVRVEMLAVGKELLIGRTLNTNAHWVGRRLARLGTMLKAVATVDDDIQEISEALRWSLSRRPDFVVTVGGLGPTPDDMTLRGVAAGLGVGLRTNEKAISMIVSHYSGRGLAGIEMTPARKKMARLPAGGEPVMNAEGTAPGVRIMAGRTVVFSLPGVPREMRAMFSDAVEPEVRLAAGPLQRVAARLMLEGVLESELAPVIQAEVRRHPGAYVKSHPKMVGAISRVDLEVAVVRRDRASAAGTVSRIVGEVSRWVVGKGGTVMTDGRKERVRRSA